MQKLKTYPNGLRLVVEKIDFVRSVTMGIWVGAGSAYENKDNNGISHLIEHMLFKGTEKRSAFDIADTIDGLGAQINAFTAKECTCYYTKSTKEHAAKCCEVLSDIFYNSTFDEGELVKEKSVIKEEISMVEDSPEDVCHELTAQCFFDGSSLGQAILGSDQTVDGISVSDIKSYMSKHYCPSNTVIAMAGNITIEEADGLVKEFFYKQEKCQKPDFMSATAHNSVRRFLTKSKPLEQASIAFAFPSLSFNHADTYAMVLVNNAIGGGMSSKLFQKIREEMGLAYSVYSYASSYLNNGMFSLYCGTNPAKKEKAIEAILKTVKDFVNTGLTHEEFARGKEQLKGNFILAQESTSTIMNTFGKMMLLAGEVFDIDEKLRQINNIQFDKCNEILRSTFNFAKVCGAMVCKDTDADYLSEFMKGY